MFPEKNCQGCVQENRCKDIYEHLGKSEAPSVVWKVIIAFLLPLVVFSVVLTVFENILADSINTQVLRTVVSLSLAVAATLVFILIIRAIGRKFGKTV